MVEVCHPVGSRGRCQEEASDVVLETHQTAQVGGEWAWSGSGFVIISYVSNSLL